MGPQESATLDVAVSGGAYGHDMARNAVEHGTAMISIYFTSAASGPARSPGECR
ncbi:hypothetical protein J4G37_01330 [Microvirga sp. 3-52]|nr:hypothetical protein [Microvirga sp. 3-52]